jgi:hypothetical protein
MALAVTSAVAAEAPRKLPLTRRSFDFASPRPGEMLENPAAGTGDSPSLAQFLPAAVNAGQAEQGNTALDVDVARSSGPGNAPAPSAPAATRPMPQIVVEAAQARLALRVTRLGIEGALAATPGADRASGAATGRLMQLLRSSLDSLQPSARGLERLRTLRIGESIDVGAGP